MAEETSHHVRILTNRLLTGFKIENFKENLEICNFLMKLKLLTCEKEESNVENLVEECLNLLNENSIGMKIIKIQFFWTEKYRSKSSVSIKCEVKKFHHETIYKNVLPILTEIVEGSRIKMADKEQVYRKIVIFIIMFAGLGSPTQQVIIKETQAALHSIFKNTELDNFLSLSKSMKEEQLFEFARVVTGIRIFNKDCKKGGEGIEDLPLILTQGVKAVEDRILELKEKVDKRIDRLVNVFCHVYGLGETSEKIRVNFDSEKLDEIKRVMIYYRQIESCLKNIVRDLKDSMVNIDELVEKLQFVLLRVHDVVRYRVAIATVQVFPLFLELSDVWVEMQEEVDVLSEINNNFVDLSAMVEMISPNAVERTFRPTPHSFLPPEPGDIIHDSETFHAGVKVCTFSTIPPEDRLQYEGFCAWTLAQTQGVLVAGNVSVGILSFENHFYSFLSAAAAQKWAKNPYFYIKTVLGIAKEKPELITLLNMADDMKTERDDNKESNVRDHQKKEISSVGIQTDLHPVESFISRNYTFSEWELRRRALKLANLTRCVTKSQQTIKSSFNRPETGVQMTEVLNKEIQTWRPALCASCFRRTKN